jgi:hypothetical protein
MGVGAASGAPHADKRIVQAAIYIVTLCFMLAIQANEMSEFEPCPPNSLHCLCCPTDSPCITRPDTHPRKGRRAG